LPHLADAAMTGLAARRSLPRYEPKPGGEVPATGERARIRRKGHDGAGRDRPDARHGARLARLNLLFTRRPQARRQVFDPAAEDVDLVQVNTSHHFDGMGQLVTISFQKAGKLPEVDRPLGDHNSELRQMASQSIHQLCALPDEALVRSEDHRSHLMPGALFPDVVNVRPQNGFGDGSGISRIILLPLDERLHEKPAGSAGRHDRSFAPRVPNSDWWRRLPWRSSPLCLAVRYG